MRVTFGSIFRNGQLDINSTAEDIVRRQREVSSGRRIHVASDDPAAMATAMAERVEMATFDNFTQTTDSVESRLMVADAAFTEILNRLTNVQSKAAAGRSTILTQTQRDAFAGEIRGAADAILTAVNTNYRGIHLFAGGQTQQPPYTPGPPVSGYQGDTRVQAVDVSRDRSVQVTFDAESFMRGTAAADVFQTLEALAVAVQTGNMAAIDTGRVDLQGHFDRVTNAQTMIGIDLARLPEDRIRLDVQRRAADARRAAVEDANLAESISGLTQADAAHRAALGSLANAGKLSLMDYIK
jgi:flagellar hook-associated protein 3 FlgL